MCVCTHWRILPILSFSCITLSDALCDGPFRADQPDPAGLGAVMNGENEATCQNGSQIRGLERVKARERSHRPLGPTRKARERSHRPARATRKASERSQPEHRCVAACISLLQYFLPRMDALALARWDVESGTTLQAGSLRGGRLEPRSIPARSGGDDVPGLDARDHAAQAPAIRERPGGAGPVRRSASRGEPLGRRSSKMLTPLRRCSLSKGEHLRSGVSIFERNGRDYPRRSSPVAPGLGLIPSNWSVLSSRRP